jgi:hypothetical protein
MTHLRTLALVLAVVTPTTALGQDKRGDDLLRVIAEGYQANRESFKFLTCKFQLVAGRAGSIEKALKGEITDRFIARGHWLVRDSKTRLDILCDPTATKAIRDSHPDQRYVSIPFPTEQFLTDGSCQLNYNPEMPLAQVRGPSENRPAVNLTPFDMGVMGMDERDSPAHVILNDRRNPRFFCKLSDVKSADGLELGVIEADRPLGTPMFKFYIDTNHGFLPRQIWLYDDPEHGQSGVLLAKVFVTEVSEVSGDRWFPKRSVLIWRPDAKNGPYDVREISVTDVDADVPPTDEAFAFRIPAGSFLKGLDPNSQARLETAVTASPDVLHNLWDQCNAVATRNRAVEASMNPKRVVNSGRIIPFLLLNVIVIAIFAVIAIVRSRSRRPRFQGN